MIAPLTLILSLALPAAAIDEAKLFTHLRKTMSLPSDLSLSLKDVQASKVPGYDRGTLEINGPRGTSRQSILLSKDGRYYFVTPVLEVGANAGAPNIHAAKLVAGSSPDMYVTKDGHFILPGGWGQKPQDLKIDPDAANRAKINLKGVAGKGPAKAKVTIVEYSDLKCPHCKNAHEELSAKLLKTYGDKVRWVPKQFPLNREISFDAAIAVACAGKLNSRAYHKLQSAFFKNQREVTPANLRSKALAFADAAGLPKKDFARCFDKKETAALIEKDIKEAESLGVNSTPTFFVNGRRTSFRGFDNFRKVVDEFLN
jgi:protein-disulfide isomerase